MTLKQLHISLLLLGCLGLASCKDRMAVGENDGKSPIRLAVGGVDAPDTELTRAVITDGTNKTMKAFDVNTKIFMVMKSERDMTTHDGYEYKGDRSSPLYTVCRGDVAASSTNVVFDTFNQHYWDDAHARSSQLSIWAYAQRGIPESSGWLQCTFEAPNEAWDGSDPLTEYKSQTYPTYQTTNPWIEEVVGHAKGAIYPCIMLWKASHNTNKYQDANSTKYQDLLFSNNLADNTSVEKTDGRLKYNFTTHKFPQSGEAEMKFYHAMSKITIHIKKGVGFGSEFNFTTGNVCLKKCNTEGTFNIKDGEFQQIKATYDIPQIYQHATADADDAFTLEALAVPNIHEFLSAHGGSDSNSRFVKDAKNLASDVMMVFTIENSLYQITSGQLYDALVNNSDEPVTNATKKTDNGTYIPMEAGKNYVFTFTIGMSGINNITAQVADWENVTADDIPANNAKVKVTLDDRGTAQTENVYFYRSIHTESSIPSDPSAIKVYDWGKGYEKSTSAGYSDNKWTTEWFWDDNKSFFHLRALLHTTNNAVSSLNTESEKQYASITSHDAESADTYDAVAWGAPFMLNKEGETYKTFTYSTTNGFDGTGAEVAQNPTHQIYHAIGATEDPIKMLLFHMMSGVHFTIQTTGNDDAHKDKVELCHNNGGEPVTYTHPVVQLVGYYPDGKVWMGTGLVDATGTKTTTSVAGITCRTTSTGAYDAQEYYYSAIPQDLASVQLYITTPDNNQYIVDLAGAKVSSGNITSNNLANPYRLVGGTGADKDKYIIDSWYPGFKYNYTFTLKKSGIIDITATIVDWESITADNEDVTIK